MECLDDVFSDDLYNKLSLSYEKETDEEEIDEKFTRASDILYKLKFYVNFHGLDMLSSSNDINSIMNIF